jgi:putative lipoprotein
MRLAAATLVLVVVPLAAASTAGCHRAPPAVVGTATYRQRVALPKDAAFAAALLDIPPAGAPVSVVAMTFTRAPAEPPIAFRIPFDRARLRASHHYLIRAQLTSKGKVLFGVDQPYTPPERGSGPPVTLTLAPLSAP